jgi:O-antigen/teichoic acid export membrane protein
MDGVSQSQVEDPTTHLTRAAGRSRARANAIANYIGRGWATIISLFCLPLFLSLLGREAYGLIGAFAVFQAWALLLDFGLTPTLNREIVRARAGMRSWQSFSNLLRSTEFLIVFLASIIVLVVYFAAPSLAAIWLKPQHLPMQTVVNAIVMMGILAAVRAAEQVYRGAIQGFEDQIWLNLVQAAIETARWIGALAVIRYVDANVQLFFAWNLFVSAVSVSVLRWRVNSILRRHAPQKARISGRELHNVRGFAGGMFLSAALTFFLTQADKLVVGSYVTLADFGIYALAGTAAAGLLQLVQPMNVAVLPRFTALVESRERVELGEAFYTASEWVSAIVLPVGLLVIIFPEKALMAWTGLPAVASSGAELLSLLMLASVLNAMVNMPYMLQLAHGWTSITNKMNAVAILVLLPVLIWATKTSGGVGAAAAMAGLNAITLVIISALVITRLLPGEFFRWFARVVVLPVLLGAVVAIGMRLSMPAIADRAGAIAQLSISAIAIGIVVFASLRRPRNSIFEYLGGRR